MIFLEICEDHAWIEFHVISLLQSSVLSKIMYKTRFIDLIDTTPKIE